MSKLTVRVSARTDKQTGEEYFEGAVQVPGLKSTKLVKNDGSTRYNSRSLVTQAAKRFAERFGLTLEAEEPTPQVRKAAKKSVKPAKPAKKAAPAATPECCEGGTCTNWV